MRPGLEFLLDLLANLLPPCRHRHLGPPITMDGLTYQRCTDCSERLRVTVDLNQDKLSIK